jgi:hypothetical protein
MPRGRAVQLDFSGGRVRTQLAGWRPALPIRRATPPTGESSIIYPRTTLQVTNPRRSVPMDIDVPFDPAALGLKEIGNLASWTVSSSKPGCGVEALRDEDTNMFWQ